MRMRIIMNWPRLRLTLTMIMIMLMMLLSFCATQGVQGASRRVKMCLQPTISGRCFGYVPSYAYDPLKRVCEPFVYGGCGGNDNRYATKVECEYNCRDV